MFEQIESLPAVQDAVRAIDALSNMATDYRVEDDAAYRDAADDLKRIKAAAKALEDARTGAVKPLNDEVKAINGWFAAPKQKLDATERAIKAAITRYADEQARIRREEQKRLDEAARLERQRAEQAAAAARAKAATEAAELQRRADEAAAAGRAAEAAKLAQRAETKIETADAKAAVLDEVAATVVAPIAHREAPKVSGVSMREVWKFEITNPAKVNPAFCVPDEVRIRKVVLAMKGDAASVLGEGVRVYVERQVASSAA
jgi:hypothetical protein